MASTKTFKSLLKYVSKNRWMLRFLPSTIYFNFHYLPFKQAIRLPIWLYKPHLVKCCGSVSITARGGVKPGMIILGKHNVSIYPNTGIMWENRGKIIFEGTAFIGGNSYISTGLNAEVVFGNRFTVYTSLKLVSYYRVSFGADCLVGWDCMFSDTDLHSITRLDGSLSKGYGEIRIGNKVWIANGCKIYKNTVISDHTVVAGDTVISKSCSSFPEYSVIGNKQELCVISNGWLDMNNNNVKYE